MFYETYKIRVQAPNAIRQHKTIEIILYLEKKSFFICIIEKFVVFLHPKRYKNSEILRNYTRNGIEPHVLI